jgi:ribonuclease VapC
LAARLREYVLDASAIFSLLEGGAAADKVAHLLKQAHARNATLSMSVINWGEVYYSLLRGRGLEQANSTRQAIIRLPIEMFPADLARVESAAALKSSHKLPYADGFAAALAFERDATLVTRDSDFRRLQSTLRILWL